MLAETLLIAVTLAAPGASPAQGASGVMPANAAGPRVGLLPRKLVHTPPSSGRRLVLLRGAAPEWLGEPAEVAAAAAAPEPVVEPAAAPEPIRAALWRPEVEAQIVRRAR